MNYLIDFDIANILEVEHANMRRDDWNTHIDDLDSSWNVHLVS